MNAIEVKGLCKNYKGFSLNISLALPQGSIMGLVGENGAGKSTTIRLIMNAAKRDAGEVFVLGTDNQGEGFRALKEDIGIVLDEAYFPETLTAKRLDPIMKCTYKNWDSACYADFLSVLSLPTNKEFKDFSRGMKMKLAIAVALSHKPRLLILDEPTSGLDPMIRDEILDIFNDFTRDETHSILISSHIVSDLEKICDYIAFIHEGKLMLSEEKDKLLDEYALIKLPNADFEAVPPEAVISHKRTGYSVEALVKKALVSPAFPTEHTTLEDIILFFARKDANK